MESAGGECGDKIFLPLLSSSHALSDKHLSGFFFWSKGGKMRRAFNKKAQKATHFMLLYERRRRKERNKEKKSAFILLHFFMTNIIALYQKMFHLTPPENIPLCHCHLNFFLIFFCVPPPFYPPIPNCV